MLPLLIPVLLSPAVASAMEAGCAEELGEACADQHVSMLQTAVSMQRGASLRATASSEADGLVERIRAEADAVTVTGEEYRGEAACSFRDEGGQPAFCAVELPEHRLVSKWLRPDMTVLELGARYGTTTCQIASKQVNSGRLVAVEPDSSTWGALEDNLKSHQCNASILKGVVGTTARAVEESGYGTRTAASTTPAAAPAMPLRKLEHTLGLRFDAALIDCEGCVEDFLSENPNALSNVTMILMEADQGKYDGDVSNACRTEGAKCVDYDAVLAGLSLQGFEIHDHFVEWAVLSKPYYKLHHFALRRQM